MPVRCDEFDGVAVLKVEGDLDEEQATLARTAARRMIDHMHVVDFVVDLGGCPFVSSDGLELLLWLKGTCEEAMGRVSLACCDENVLKVLEMTRLRSRFEHVSDLEEAVRRMRA